MSSCPRIEQEASGLEISICEFFEARFETKQDRIGIGAHKSCMLRLDRFAMVETFSPTIDLHQIDAFLSPALECADGKVVAPQRPGVGFELDWSELSRYVM